MPPVSKQSTVRRPRGIVRINGTRASFINAKVISRTHFTADTFTVELEPWKQPEGFGLSYFADAQDVEVEVLVGMLPPGAAPGDVPSSLTSLIIGAVDDADISPLTGRLQISGRDYSGRLIDARTTNKWPNQTASQIVTHFAEAFGLTPDVTPTKTPAGKFYDPQYSHIARNTPVWDIIVYLAQHEGFDAYVHGKTLYFGPPQADSDPSPWPIVVQKDANGTVWSTLEHMTMHRSLTISKDFSVTIRSHNPATGKSVIETASRAGGKHAATSSASGYASKRQNYMIDVPNLTPEQATQMAQKLAADISKFERIITGDCEGDEKLTVRRMARMTGSQTSFDQSYYFDTIERSIDMQGGFTMHIKVKNHTTESNPLV